jgi:hypothetical protein
VQKLRDLHSDNKCTQYFHDLLYMVEEEMLVVRAKSRIDSERMYRRLDMMHQRALNDQAYFYEACKSSRQVKKQDPLHAAFKQRNGLRR